MIARLIGRARCLLGRHERSRSHAKLTDEVYRSRCRHCGIAMRQIGRLDWEVDDGQPYDPKSGRFFEFEDE